MWRPQALRLLQQRAQRGKTGPCEAAREALGMSDRRWRKKKGRSKTEKWGGSGGNGKEEEAGGSAVDEEEAMMAVDRREPERMMRLVKPADPLWLFNANTAEQWQQALRMYRETRHKATADLCRCVSRH